VVSARDGHWWPGEMVLSTAATGLDNVLGIGLRLRQDLGDSLE